MKLTDVLAKILKKNSVKQVFGLQGGAVVHIFDSLEKYKIQVTYTNHEESAALAATANAKVNENIGCAVVTTGPGSTNAITGLLAAWQDSVPCLFISGQARSTHVSYGKKVRQVGTQEVNICDIVRPITKYTKFINNKNNFINEVNYAIKIAKEGRPGPVWLDIPIDLQWIDIKFPKNKLKKISISNKKNVVKNKLKLSLKLINQSSRPLLVLGYGVRSSNKSILKIKKLIFNKKIPFVTTWNGLDLLSTNNKFNLGIIGMSGQRGANKAIFKSDLLLCLGTHLSIPQTTPLTKNYAKDAKKLIVNIDKNQLNNLNLSFDCKINADVGDYLKWLSKQKIKKFCWEDLNKFKKMNWYVPKKTNKPNSNFFIHTLTSRIKDKFCLVIDGGGTALYSGFQSSAIKEKDRTICSSGISAMGTGLAETIGVWKSGLFKKIVCVIGDGSFLMNVQDLQTIVQNKINVSVIVVNNNGYLAIRHTQKEFLEGRYYGTHPKWNLTMPSFKKISKAFGIDYFKVNRNSQINGSINKIIKRNGPLICELIVSDKQDSLFKQGYLKNKDGKFSPQPLDEMFPFLPKPLANTNN